MDCDTARLLLAFRRPATRPNVPQAETFGLEGELTAKDAAELSAHVAGCPGCAAAAGRNAGFDAAVAAAMTDVPVPAGLGDRILKKALARRRVQIARRVAQWVGTAACVAITLGLVYGVFRAYRPAFDFDALTLKEDIERDDPEAAVREWLTAERLPTDLPLDLDFGKHVFHGKERVAGRDVPVIVFQTWQKDDPRPITAKLFLLRGDQFDLRGLKNAQSSFFIGQDIRPSEQDAKVRYVILFSSPTTAPFRKPPRPIG